MDYFKEALIKDFYSRKLHLEDMCDFNSPSERCLSLCEDIFSCLIQLDCQEIIRVIQSAGIIYEISSGDIPQFSNFDDCVYKVPILVRDCGIHDLTFTQLGFMLRTKPRKVGADTKYGENHSKTSAHMGLCSIVNGRIFPSYLGMSFCKLCKEKQKKLLPKLVLFIPFIFNLFATSAKYDDVINSVSFLSVSTQKRRLTNIWFLIAQVNKVLPYELQIIRY